MKCANRIQSGGCHLPNRHCAWPKCEEPTAPPLEMVNHPKHYNNHPSGVECIQLARLLSFNIGNALKYVMRRDDKGTAKQDINKAIFYLKDEIDYWFNTASVMHLPTAIPLAEKIYKAEENKHARGFYVSLHALLVSMQGALPSTDLMKQMVASLEELSKTYP